MLVIIITFIIWLGLSILAIRKWRDSYSDEIPWILSAAAFIILIPVTPAVFVKATTGMIPTYATGTRDGFITKSSIKGVFWKTNEAQIQVGTGEMAALQEPFAFSIPDEDMAELVSSYLGERVRIEYNQWLIMPWRDGETNYECVGILPIND